MNLDAFAEYSSAWLAIVAAAFVGALCLNSLLKRIGGVRSVTGRSLRWAIVMTVLAAFTLPVALPNAEQINAPAFIVLLFESFFQTQGDPAQARRMMLAGLPLGLCWRVYHQCPSTHCLAKIAGCGSVQSDTCGQK
jgi:chromate transport protein ChrA